MRYYGGKNKIGKEIAFILEILANHFKTKKYLEPFCGSLGVLKHMLKYQKCIASDYNKDLILLWKSLKNDTFKKPQKVSKKKYDQYKISSEHSAIRGFVGLAYSYGGGWWNGYCPKIGDRDYVDETYRSLIKMKPLLKNINFKSGDYKKINPDKIDKRVLIYCDPPYFNRAQKYVKGKSLKKGIEITNGFDSNEFWNIMKKWSKNHIVLVSEIVAPKEFICIWEKSYNSKISSSNTNRVEKLFIHKKYINSLKKFFK